MTIVAHDVGTEGGMEHQLGRLASGLAELGHDVTVIARRCRLPPGTPARWIRVRGPARPFSVAYLWFALMASLALCRHRRGVVHATGAIVLNRVEVATVHFCHAAYNRESAAPRTDRREALYRINARLVAAMSELGERYAYRPRRTRRLVGVSTGVKRELERFFPAMRGAIAAIPNGVDTTRFRPDAAARTTVLTALDLPANALVGVFLGGEWERKGLAYAIDALRLAPHWHLLVVGPGDEQRFADAAEISGVLPRVHFVGRQADPERWLAAGDAFVLPTSYETFSMATFEAAACGLPLLNTVVNGVEEILEDGETGWAIERHGEDIGRRLLALEADAVLRGHMGDRARHAVQRYDWDSVVRDYSRTYASLAKPDSSTLPIGEPDPTLTSHADRG